MSTNATQGSQFNKAMKTTQQANFVTFLPVVGSAMDFSKPEDLFQFVEKAEDLLHPEKYKYSCKICQKWFYSRIATRNHVESIHYPGMFKYTCSVCGKECISKSAVNYHITMTHNKSKEIF